MSETIRVMVYEPGKPGDLREVPNTLESLQAIVGGYIEQHHDSASGAYVYCDEDGEFKVLQPNRQFGAWKVAGTAFLCAVRDNQEASLTDEQVTRIKALYG